MIDSDYVLWIQLVMLRQRSPSILSVQKFVGEPKLQFRMILQIGNRANAELAGPHTQHHKRVGIVKPERFGHADAGFAHLVRDLLERQFIAAFQNLLRDRSGIFRVSIDLAAAQRLPENDRAAHSLAMLSRNSSLDQAALRDFAEDIRFREFFRADNDRLSSQRTRQKNKASRNAGKKKETSEGFLFSCFPNSIHKTARLRWALINSETKELAGFSRRSASEPCWTIRPSFTSTLSSPR